jgi:thiol-disulfide isomerase/thioredoxin
MKSKWIWIGVIIMLCSLVVMSCGKKTQPPIDEPDPIVDPTPDPPPPPDPRVTIEKVDAISIMINNHDEADPHSGLQEATFVYEFLVEGGITRFLAVFDKPLTNNFLIGPVRSLRPYFAETAKEYGNVVACAGMDSGIRQQIAPLKLKLVEDTGGNFWRDNSRVAPHNLYTDLKQMYSARGASEVRSEKILPPELPVGVEGKNIEVVISQAQIVKYTYSDEEKQYLRFQDGSAHTDRETGKQYGATRVIVRKNVHSAVTGTPVLRIDLSGSGTAVLYEAGQKHEITWEKKDGKTIYRYADGAEVDLRLGNTWIQVVR